MLIKENTKHKIAKFVGWLHIVSFALNLIITLSMIVEMPTKAFNIAILSSFGLFLIGYLILKYPEKAKKMMFFEK